MPDSPAPMPALPPALAWLAAELRERQAAGLWRTLRDAVPLPGGRVARGDRVLLNLSSNDYLGLATDLDLGVAVAAAGGLAGATASRLVVGSHPLAAAVERRFAALKGTPAALVFGSGYLANVSVIPALVGRGDAIFADRLNHASLVDGARLSGARLHRYAHADLDHLADLLRRHPARRRLIVTDSVFSMDGDCAPLAAIVALKDAHGAMLMVDEAHAGGVFGPDGAGLVRAAGLEARVEVQLGTFSKAYGVYGAAIAGSEALIAFLHQAARGHIYTTGLPPLVLALVAQSLELAAAQPWRRETLARHVARWREGLRAAGLPDPGGPAPILPLVVGDARAALALAADLEAAGVAAVAIRPPTVPAGTCRIRFSLSAAHRAEDLDRALATVAALAPRHLPESPQRA